MVFTLCVNEFPFSHNLFYVVTRLDPKDFKEER